MPDLTADPSEPRAHAAERIAAACHELRRLHERHGWVDHRGFWFPFDPACVSEEWTREKGPLLQHAPPTPATIRLEEE